MIERMIMKSGKKVLFTIFTQGLLSIAAIIIGFGLPKFLPIAEYSRWQLFYFYVGYVNYLQFGFNDGLILNFSGKKFEEFPWNSIKRATIRIVVYQAMGLGILLIAAFNIKCDFAVVGLLAFSCIPTVLMCILSAVLLAGNKTYDYNLLCLIIRLAFVVLIIAGVCASITNAEYYMCADILSKIVIILIFYIYEKRYIPHAVQKESQKIGKFIRQNCTNGIIVASTILLLGLLPMCGRVVIQLLGSETEYAMFSFAISMLSIILTFTNAIGTVAFPMLKNLTDNKNIEQQQKLKRLYDEILWICLWGIVIVNIIVSHFLHEYITVLKYFPILLAVCWPLGKIQSIIYPYYKVYRKENDFLKICIVGLAITFGLSFFIYPFVGLTGLAVVALLGVLLTYITLEAYFEQKIIQHKNKLRVEPYIMLGIFLLTSMTLKNGMFALVYGSIVVIHLCLTITRTSKK